MDWTVICCTLILAALIYLRVDKIEKRLDRIGDEFERKIEDLRASTTEGFRRIDENKTEGVLDDPKIVSYILREEKKNKE